MIHTVEHISRNIVELAALASTVCASMLWRIIKVQRATIKALEIHIQTLSHHIEQSRGLSVAKSRAPKKRRAS